MTEILRLRPVRHILLTSALVLVACAVLFVLQLLAFSDASAQLRGMTARSTATVQHNDGDTSTVRFGLPGGGEATASVVIDGVVPKVDSELPVFYDAARPEHAAIRGATPLVAADRASTYATVTVIAALLVLITDVAVLVSRFVLPARAAAGLVRLPVRRVKIQRGVLARSWLETETATPRWIPVYFSPALIGLASPADVVVHGDPARDRWVMVRVGDERIHPAGAVRPTEPRGRRLDNPAEPDENRLVAAGRPVSLARQLRADLPVLAIAPVVGVFWALVDGTGIAGWLSVTVLIGAFGFWWAALRGSDPS
ncbi:hypothetical protein [Amycolatopsis sp. H20-H5]|uniref:hypothetical protein n=1 Tax=Amycolatopsis sp. H20-H5 TaxID=3046309 RepID=UPI002DBDE07C|nr:hypothetical protein [Amycolatopsis sp. H20-H5]MEC3976782.1 hypothetical protein [Amycolatopsis sp. H20-H5]